MVMSCVNVPEVNVSVAVRTFPVIFSLIAVSVILHVPASPETGAIVNQSATVLAFHSRVLVKLIVDCEPLAEPTTTSPTFSIEKLGSTSSSVQDTIKNKYKGNNRR